MIRSKFIFFITVLTFSCSLLFSQENEMMMDSIPFGAIIQSELGGKRSKSVLPKSSASDFNPRRGKNPSSTAIKRCSLSLRKKDTPGIFSNKTLICTKSQFWASSQSPKGLLEYCCDGTLEIIRFMLLMTKAHLSNNIFMLKLQNQTGTRRKKKTK